jgi:hypothetical protein
MTRPWFGFFSNAKKCVDCADSFAAVAFIMSRVTLIRKLAPT